MGLLFCSCRLLTSLQLDFLQYLPFLPIITRFCCGSRTNFDVCMCEKSIKLYLVIISKLNRLSLNQTKTSGDERGTANCLPIFFLPIGRFISHSNIWLVIHFVICLGYLECRKINNMAWNVEMGGVGIPGSHPELTNCCSHRGCWD